VNLKKKNFFFTEISMPKDVWILTGLAALLVMATLPASQDEPISVIGEFNMAGPTPRDLQWTPGLVRDKKMNTPGPEWSTGRWPLYNADAGKWLPTEISVIDLNRILSRGHEYQGDAWVRDRSSPTGFSQR